MIGILFAAALSAQNPTLAIDLHVEDVGDMQGPDNKWLGTKGQYRRLEGFSIQAGDARSGLGLEYMCRIEETGDTAWIQEGGLCGTAREGRQLEGYAVRLTGPAKGRFAVRYYCHLEGVGDIGPIAEGEFCGARNLGARLEAIKVVLIRRTD